MSPFAAVTVSLGALALAAWWMRRSWLRYRAGSRLDAAGPTDAGGRTPSSWVVVAPLALGVVAAGVASALGFTAPIALAVGLDLAALGFVAAALRMRAQGIRAEGQLNEALRLMVAALRAGSSPVAALERAGTGVGAPVGPRLRDVAGRLRLGEDPRLALSGLAQDDEFDSLRLFAQALAVQWRAGGSLQNSLVSIERYVGDRVEVQRRIESQAAPTRSSVLILVGATVAVGLMSWSNDPLNVERFVASDLGELGIAATFVLQGVSFLWMWHMSKVDL